MSPRGLYILHCSGCHGQNGAGALAAGVPAFQNSISTIASDAEGRVYILHVPGIAGAGLRDEETAAVLNFVVSTWGDAAAIVEPFTAVEVAALRQSPVRDVVELRRSIAARLARDGVDIAAYPWP
jgi:mono/diheme cytochrome c family protein